MKQPYYKLPLDFNGFFENGGKFKKCTELESIDQHIELLLTTSPGEHRFDSQYGCRIWEMDFENIASLEQLGTLFKEYVQEAIGRYEPRITEVKVEVEMRDIVREERINRSVTVRKRADIYVSAQLVSTDEQVRLGYSLYLGPLSNE